MSDIIKEEKYILANITLDESGKQNNNNKFWNIIWYSNNSVTTEWGRVGDPKRELNKPFRGSYEAEKFFNSKVRTKLHEGYKPLKILTAQAGQVIKTGNSLEQIVREQIQTDSPDTMEILKWLIKENRHQIETHTTLKYNVDTGMFQDENNPLGPVTPDSIVSARELLASINDYVNKQNFADRNFDELVHDYLHIIPRVLPRRGATVESIFPNNAEVQKQLQILDSLEASIQTMMSNPAQPNVQPEKIFEVKLLTLPAGREFDRVKSKYMDGRLAMHSVYRLRVGKIYQVEIASMARAFEKVSGKINNVQEMWHGSNVGNLLSIFKKGIIIPPYNSSFCAGRLFGNGIYSAPCPTKASNYSYGYWSGGSSNRCFVFLCDMALGKSYTPASGSESLPKPGYDSVWAKKGVTKMGYSTLQNDEVIVYNPSQCNPKYLVELID